MKTLKLLLFLPIVLLCLTITKADIGALSTALNNVTRSYLSVKNGLVTGNVAATQTGAKEMIAALTAVPDKDMTADQRKTWAAYKDKLEFDSRHISESSAIDHQREHFASLSTNLFVVLKDFKVNTFTLYKQYCPMKKLYWVSETAAIKNPYYGAGDMATCGVTKEELKPVK